jgi:hypothetical protein
MNSASTKHPLFISNLYLLHVTNSKRGEAMPASPIRKLVPYAEAAKKEVQLFII